MLALIQIGVLSKYLYPGPHSYNWLCFLVLEILFVRTHLVIYQFHLLKKKRKVQQLANRVSSFLRDCLQQLGSEAGRGGGLLNISSTWRNGTQVQPEDNNLGDAGQREREGARISWNVPAEPRLTQMWNPWSKDIPWIVFVSHPLLAGNTLSLCYSYKVVWKFGLKIKPFLNFCWMQDRAEQSKNKCNRCDRFNDRSSLSALKAHCYSNCCGVLSRVQPNTKRLEQYAQPESLHTGIDYIHD